MLNVLYVYKTSLLDSQGGIEQFLEQLCQSTARLGVKNRLVTLSKNPVPAVIFTSYCEIYRYPLNFEIASCGFSVQALKHFKQHCDWADIVHYQFPWPFGDVMQQIWQIKKPIIVTYHSDVIRQKKWLFFYTPLMKKFLNRADVLVCSSENYKKSSPTLKKFAQKTHVIPIGLDEDSYPKPSYEEIKRLEARCGKDFFLFVGVLRYYKGISYLLKAVENSELPVVIAGDGQEFEALKMQAITLNLSNVIFLGKVTEIEKMALFKLAKAVVFPSCERSEAFGITLVEAAMCGKAMISTELETGTSFINQHGVTGLVIKPKDSNALRVAMFEFENNLQLVERFGKMAKQRYYTHFSSEQMTKNYIDLYELIHHENKH